MFGKVASMRNLCLALLLALTVGHTQAACKNEKRAENQEACKGQLFGNTVPYPGDCTKFLVCVHVCEYPTVRECPIGLWWDNTYKFCNIPKMVNCDNGGDGTITTTTTTTSAVTPTTTQSSDISSTTKGRCNNERRSENKAACAGQRFGKLVAYPGDCSKFIICDRICEYPVVEECPIGLWWDNSHKFCNVPLMVNCDENENEGTTITTPTTTESSDSSSTTKGRCNNERRPENKAACSGKRFGALVAYPGDCSKFIICDRICEYPVVEECPIGLWWDNSHKFCNVPLMVNCDENEGTTVPVDMTTTTESSDSSSTTKGRCNNERRPENKAACSGKRFGALVAYPGDCSKFIICDRICEYPVVEECPIGLWWDNRRKFCNVPLMVNCDENEGTTVPVDMTTTTESSDSSSTTKGRCNNERRPENKAACAGKRFGALVAYPGDCSKFIICDRICEYPVVEECPIGLWWDNRRKFCNIPLMVNCDENEGTTVPVDKTTTEAITPPTPTTTDSTSTTKARCDNENRPENQAACAGQVFAALVAYPGDCSKFLVCIHLCEYPTVRECPPGLLWDNTYKFCGLPQYVTCDETEATTRPVDSSTTTESNEWAKDCWAPEGMTADICWHHNNGVLIRYPYNCNAYINCTMGCPVMQYCQPDKVFNALLNICDTPDMDQCEDLPLPSSTTEMLVPTTTTPTTTTSMKTTTSESFASPSDKCIDQEMGTSFSYEQNCQQYVYCTGKGGFLILSCPSGHYYTLASGVCEASDDSTICLH